MTPSWKTILSCAFLLVGGSARAESSTTPIPHPDWDPTALVFDDGITRAAFPIALQGLNISLFVARQADEAKALSFSQGPWGENISLSGHLFDYIGAGFLSRSRYTTFDSPIGPCPAREVTIPGFGRKFFAAVPYAKRDRIDLNWALKGKADAAGEEWTRILKTARRVGPGDATREATVSDQEIIFAGLGLMLPRSLPVATEDIVLQRQAGGITTAFLLAHAEPEELASWLYNQGLTPISTTPQVQTPLAERDIQIAGLSAKESGVTITWTEEGKSFTTCVRYLRARAQGKPFELRFAVRGTSSQRQADTEPQWRELLASLVFHPLQPVERKQPQ